MSLVDQALDPRIYDRWEVTRAEERERTIRERLREHIAFCRDRLPFYRERLDGFRSDDPHPLRGVPVMDASDMRAGVPPTGDQLVTAEGGNYTVFQSGGTTGNPKTTLFSHAELDLLDLPNARGFYAVGLRADDRVANQFAVGGLYMTFVHINRMLQGYGCMNFPFSNHCDPALLFNVVKSFGINCFTGISSVVLDTLRGFPDAGDLRLRKIFYGGEHIYDADVTELERRFEVEIVAAPGYGTVDSWYIGYQCSECPRGVFHAHDDQTFIEIHDEELDRPCGPGQPGALYVTPTVRRLTPVVRYRVGDRAKWLVDPCACGRTTPRFALLGRADDTLRIGFDSVDYDAVQKVLSECELPLSSAMQMQKLRRDGRDQLVIRVEREGELFDPGGVGDAFETAILAARPSLREFIENGAVWPLQVEICAPGSLERNPRTGKLIRVIDAIGDSE